MAEEAAEGAVPLVVEGEDLEGAVVVVHLLRHQLLRHLPEAVTVEELEAAEGAVPLVVAEGEARRPSRAPPRRWLLRNRLPHLLLLVDLLVAEEEEEGVRPPLVVVVAEAVVLLWHPPVAEEEARRPQSRAKQCFLLRMRAPLEEVGKLLRREDSLPLRHRLPSRASLQPRMAPLGRRSSPQQQQR